MAGAQLYIIGIFLSVILTVYGQESLVIAESPHCSKRCEETYAPLTQSALLGSCLRGCRLYNIVELIEKRQGLDSCAFFVTRCDSDCTQAYPLESKYGLRQACEEGCQNQMEECARQPHRFSDNTAEVKDNATKSEIGADESGKVWNLGTPVLQVRKVMAQVVGQFHVLRTSIMTYFLQDDNTLIAVQSQPQVIVEMLPNDSNEEPLDEDQSLSASHRLTGAVEVSADGVQRVALGSGRQYAYLLHLLMLLGVVSLTLLGLSYCLLIVRIQQKKTRKAANLAVAVQKEPLKLVRPEDLTKLSLMDEEELALPLPNKHDLALTHANV